jgi:fibronectin type 3 domain-containing protein
MKQKLSAFFLLILLLVLLGDPLMGSRTVQAATAPGRVTLVSAKAYAYNQITISWKKTTNATHYRIYRKNGSYWQWIATVAGTKTSYTHTSSAKFPIGVGKSYTYTVRAYNSNTKLSGSYDSQGVTTKTVPDTPVLTSIKTSSGKVTLTWKKAGGASKYCVYYRTASSRWTRIAVLGSETLSYTHTSGTNYPITPGTTYQYTVRAYQSETKVYGAYQTSGLSIQIPPATVTLVKASATASQVDLTWEKAAGATHYVIYYKIPMGSWTRLATVAGNETTTYTHKASATYPLNVGTSYIYTVRSYNSSQKLAGSYDSQGLTVTIPGPAETPAPTVTPTPTETPTPTPTPEEENVEYEPVYLTYAELKAIMDECIPDEIVINGYPNQTSEIITLPAFGDENVVPFVYVTDGHNAGYSMMASKDNSYTIRFISYNEPVETTAVIQVKLSCGTVRKTISLTVLDNKVEVVEEDDDGNT